MVLVPDNEMASVRFSKLLCALQEANQNVPPHALLGILVHFWASTRLQGVERITEGELRRYVPLGADGSDVLIQAMLGCGYLEADRDQIHVVDNKGLEARLIKRREDGAAAGRKSAAKRAPVKRKASKPKEGPTPFQIACTMAWNAYANAYEARFRQDPTDNAKVRSLVQTFVKRVGQKEAPEVLHFYVYHPNDFYMQRGYQLDHAVRDAESLRTQWANNTPITRQAVGMIASEAAYQEQQRQIKAGLI